MSNEDLINNAADIRAAEYVLGTQTADERRDTELAMRSDVLLRGRVNVWERSFARFNGLVEPKQPSRQVWQNIEQRIDAASASAQVQQTKSSRRFAPWFVGVMATLLVAVILVPNMVRDNSEFNTDLVAVLADGAEAPVWLVKVSSTANIISVDLLRDASAASRVLPQLRGSGSPEQGDLQLWLVNDDGSALSMGLVPNAERFELDIPSNVELGDSDRLMVTLESTGGASSGKPSSNVVYEGLLNAYRSGS